MSRPPRTPPPTTAGVPSPADPTAPGWLESRLASAIQLLPADLRPLPPGPAACTALAGYVDRLVAWGARINLSGARDAATLVDEHLADALPLAALLPPGSFEGVDVGSGAGLPGAVLAALRPDTHWTLLEPSGKKSAFLSRVRRDFQAHGISLDVVQERLEDHLGRPKPVRYDVAVSRAVWEAPEWIRRGADLMAAGGLLIGQRTDTGAEPPPGSRQFRYSLAGRNRSVLLMNH